LTLSFAGAPASAADPTVDQIYQAERSGHPAEAQQLMDQVLRDHPESEKAHYVQAELFAHAGDVARARAELARAEQLAPGLPKESPQSVQELKSQLGLIRREGRPSEARPFGMTTAPSAPHFPWGTVLILAVVAGVVWMLFRRRNTYVQYPAGPASMGGPGAAYGPGGPAGYGPGGGVVGGGGIGSNIAGGLAGGLAAGAGIVAGEELAHHFLDGGQRTVVPPPAEDSSPSNSDMGGNDFGVNDPGSWDDGSSGGDSGGGGGGGGGDDWT
jgi:uncharacterized protein